MRARYVLTGLLVLISQIGPGSVDAAEEVASALLPLEARNSDGSGEEDVISSSYVLPNQIFNDGKPYYARQDPISGQLDFTAKKPAGIEPELNEVLNSKEKIVLNGISTPNIHDFLNLPVKYSSSKFVYPLVSSSYANLKYQGSNKNFITNKKPTMVAAPISPAVGSVAPSYHSDNYFTTSSTKLTAVTTTATSPVTTSSSTRPTKSTASSTAATTTRPPTTTTTAKTTVATTKASTTTTTRRTITTRRPVSLSVPTTAQPPRFSTTRKKFVPSKKPTSQSTTSTTPGVPVTSGKPTEHQLQQQQTRPTKSSSDVTFTTHHPTPQAEIFPTEPTTVPKMYSTPSVGPLLSNGAAGTTPRPQLSAQIDRAKIQNLDPAEVYHTLGQKNTKLEQEQSAQQAPKPAMTLSDIFNNIAEEEIGVVNNYQQNQGFDAQGNLIQPLAPSQPSPFAVQPQQSQQSNPAASPSKNVLSVPPYGNEQKVISGSPDSYAHQYVSYQVQQPNVMQYRPIPGQINNVVISPGQQSASFVLGSQQQVSHQGNFGNVQGGESFPKETGSVQYGQVINEEIANVNRPLPPNQPQQFSSPQQPAAQSIYQQRPSYPPSPHTFQANDNRAPATSEQSAGGAASSYQGPPPEAPSPYQQLPLIGSKPSQKPPSKAPESTVSTASANSNSKAQQPTTSSATSSQSNAKDTQELSISTNIRFPSNHDDSLEMHSSIAAPGPPSSPHINGHAQPVSLQQLQHANPVVFPKAGDQNAAGANVQIQQHEVVNLKQHEQKLKFPTQQQTRNEAPSQDMMPPPRYAAFHNTQVQSAGPFYKEFDRKAQPPAGPHPNANLPNILPQFRPNAKISMGHSPNFKHEPGNYRQPAPGMKSPYNPSTPPQFANRRQPIQQPQPMPSRYPMNRILEYDQLVGAPHVAGAVNRRVYRLPPSAGQRVPHLRDRMYARRPGSPLRTIDNYYPVERHAPLTPEPPLLNDGSNLEDYEEEDLVINDPPQAPNKDLQNASESKLEAVVTLQMLQSQKKTLNGDDTGAGEIQVTADNNPQEALAGSVIDQASKAVNEDHVSEKRESALHQESAASSTVEYQNTPFSVVREQPQEPILKNKKPQSLQQQSKRQPLHTQKFPYPIEKPDSSYTKIHPLLPVPGMLVAPRIITGGQNSGTEAPIAIAYTPTESSFIRQGPTKPDLVLPHTQTEQVLSNDFDLRGHNFEKNFMAPFYPSVSLGAAGNSVSEASHPAPSNWKIVSTTPDEKKFEKNNINRADVQSKVDKTITQTANPTEANTEKYSDLDSFQPQLQGGFKPIFPADFMLAERQANLSEEKPDPIENDNKPVALALTREQTTPSQALSKEANASVTSVASLISTSPTPTTSPQSDVAEIATSTSTKAPSMKSELPKQKKSTFETSLAELLFGDEQDDLEDGARKAIRQDNPPARPLNVARMGPRSLVFT